MGLSLVTPPATEPISVEDFAAHVRWDVDPDTLGILNAAVRAARALAEEWTRRQFVQVTYKLTLDCFANVIELPRPPLVDVNSITYIDENGDTQTLDPSVYDVVKDCSPGLVRLAFQQSWPTTRRHHDVISIEYQAGWATAADVPDAAKHAIRLIGAHYMQNPQAVIAGDRAQSIEVPMGARALLDTLLVPEIV